MKLKNGDEIRTEKFRYRVIDNELLKIVKEVPPEIKGTFHTEPYVDKCPACGGDRNLPPLTGCPQGSHYGTYC